jgi:hypothetical protein
VDPVWTPPPLCKLKKKVYYGVKIHNNKEELWVMALAEKD